MKKFLSENWYKLMTGTSMLVFSFGFLIYAVSPTYANNSNKKEFEQIPDKLSPLCNQLINFGCYFGSEVD